MLFHYADAFYLEFAAVTRKQTGLTDTSGENIGKLNPFRYRAYCYDDDTKLYVTASRYYDLELCRFLCADNFDVVKAEMFKKLN